MQIINWYKEFIQQFTWNYLLFLFGLSIAITILLFFNKNKKSKLMLQIINVLIIFCITMWLIAISSFMLYFSMEQLLGNSQHDKKIIKDVMFYATYAPMLLCFPLLYVHIVLQRNDKNSIGLWITDLLIKSIIIYEILLFFPHYTIINKM